ncbi:MAG: sodium:calcium antiporter [Chloroflexi bacterium]|nr:sodium:calcium antiporter [Chloroflexota bacterium]
MTATVFVLIGAMVLVFIAAVGFVNAIEYIGYRLHLGGSFVGAIIAPLFTSLPEMTVFLVAVFAYSGEAGQEIGVGTLFGQPFMASSLSYGLVGISVLIGYFLKRRKDLVLCCDKSLAIPYVFITILFPLTIIPGLPVFQSVASVKYIFSLVFLGGFLLYIWMMFRKKEAELIDECEESYFCKYGRRVFFLRGPIVAAILQVAVAVAVLYIGSKTMVQSVDIIARRIGMSPLGLALILIPAATAIPETTSALIWGFRGRDTLALGSLVGEKILYSTFYPALGLVLTAWALDKHAYFSVVATTTVSLILLYYILKGRLPWYALCVGLFFFIAYGVLIFAYQF